MLGVHRQSVRIEDHHPDWPVLAEAACRDIRRLCGHLIVDVQHVGSTAVPDLAAKPVLDIVAAMAASDCIPELRERLASGGYIHRGDHGDQGGQLFVREAAPEVRTIHLHVVEHRDRQWRNYLRFRDLLRHDADIRQRYAALKRELARIYRNDRPAYTRSKNAFIRDMLDSD